MSGEADSIIGPRRDPGGPDYARLARGPHPGGVLSDAAGRVLVNFLQQDLDRPDDTGYVPPPWASHAGRRGRKLD